MKKYAATLKRTLSHSLPHVLVNLLEVCNVLLELGQVFLVAVTRFLVFTCRCRVPKAAP